MKNISSEAEKIMMERFERLLTLMVVLIIIKTYDAKRLF